MFCISKYAPMRNSFKHKTQTSWRIRIKKNYIPCGHQTKQNWVAVFIFNKKINKKPTEKATTATEMTETIELAKTWEQLL